MERTIEIGEIYRHFKGNLVKIIALAKDSETLEKLVIYEHLDTKETWARPYDMFLSLVDKEKYPDVSQEYRFEKVDD